MKRRKRPPMQPVIVDAKGVLRFQSNALVEYLLDWATERGCGLNELARLPDIPRSDWEQFAQLIGYSVGGFSDLSCVRDATYEKASKRARLAMERRSQVFMEQRNQAVALLKRMLRVSEQPYWEDNDSDLEREVRAFVELHANE